MDIYSISMKKFLYNFTSEIQEVVVNFKLMNEVFAPELADPNSPEYIAKWQNWNNV